MIEYPSDSCFRPYGDASFLSFVHLVLLTTYTYCSDVFSNSGVNPESSFDFLDSVSKLRVSFVRRKFPKHWPSAYRSSRRRLSTINNKRAIPSLPLTPIPSANLAIDLPLAWFGHLSLSHVDSDYIIDMGPAYLNLTRQPIKYAPRALLGKSFLGNKRAGQVPDFFVL